MRQRIIITIITMIVGLYITYPKPEEDVYVYKDAIEVTPIMVTILGEVNMPGTYAFFEEPLMYDVIQMAGGITKDADDREIPYERLINQDMVYQVPAINQDEQVITVLVNVNEASFAELLDVPYMSESRAAYIIMYREMNGDFQSLDELVNVKYIGAATLEKIRPYLTLS